MLNEYVNRLPKHFQNYISQPQTQIRSTTTRAAYQPTNTNDDNDINEENVETANENANADNCKTFCKLYFLVRTLLTCFLYYFDIISDLYLLAKYYENKQNLYFGLTLSFIVLSIIIVKFGLFLTGFLFLCHFICGCKRNKKYDDNELEDNNDNDGDKKCCRCKCDCDCTCGCVLSTARDKCLSFCKALFYICLIMAFCLVQLHMVVL